MSKQIITGSYGVDAGNISVVDLDYIESCGGKFGSTASSLCKKVEVEPGEYKCSISIPNCWAGKIKHNFILKTKGTIVIGDVCYLFSSSETDDQYWSDFLSATDYLDESFEYCFFANTGGDGEFKPTVTLEKI